MRCDDNNQFELSIRQPATSAWKDVYFTTFPLFVYATKDPHTTWKQHFKDTTAGSVTSHVQLYDFSIYNMNAKDYSVWLSADGYSGSYQPLLPH